LFDLIRYTNPELKNAFYFAMRDTLVTDTIKNAMKIAYGATRHRVVTLNGELIEIVGTMQGGGKPRKGGMSNTQKNINVDETDIKNNYQLCLDQYNQLKNEYNAQDNLLNKTINEINNIEKTIQNLEIEINNLKKVINDCENQLSSLNNELNKYNTQEQSINELNTQIDSEQQAINKHEDEIDSLKKKIAIINSKMTNEYVYDTNAIKKELNNFFQGWIGYMNLAGSSKSDVSDADKELNAVISTLQ
jgi:structural maintenance of chromosome 4